MREVERLCSRITIIHRGRILAEAELAELKGTHGHDDLEEFFLDLVGGEEARHRAELGAPHEVEAE
jgi:sodium transport system ATP-binding protein